MWRNWQTHKTKDLMKATSCRFKSCQPHHKKCNSTFVGLHFFIVFTHLTGLEFHLGVSPKNWQVFACHFFIHCKSNGISSRNLFACISSPKVYNISRRLYSLLQWWYTMLSIDDIQFYKIDDMQRLAIDFTLVFFIVFTHLTGLEY